MKTILFIDRDGTIIKEPADEQIDSLEKLEFLPGVISGLRAIAASKEFILIMVTNQDGLGTASFPEETFWPAHNKMLSILEGEGIMFDDILIDKSLPEHNLPTRKPGTALLTKYISSEYDLANSFVIGDRLTDIELARNLNCKSIFLSAEPNSDATLSTTNWQEISEYLINPKRVATINRKTNETDVNIELNIDGTGKAQIATGLNFFNHMLEQIAKHSGSDLKIKVKGDLHVDEHHTIEDTAIALGEAFYKAIGNKRGIERYGYMLPMDDCLAQVAIDFGGRSWLEWNVTFTREKIGDMPAEMFYHFFKSFSDAAKCNLNIKAEGNNEHHKIEAIFKALAKSIKMAVKKDKANLTLPSTKGML